MKMITLQDSPQTVMVDDHNFHILSRYSWFMAGGRYARTQISKVNISMHRLIMGPVGQLIVDHIDNNPLNNQESNLRITTSSSNSQRKVSAYAKHRISPFRGVSFQKVSNRWRGETKKDGVSRSAPHSRCEVFAARSYDALIKKLHGEHGYLNSEKVGFDQPHHRVVLGRDKTWTEVPANECPICIIAEKK